mmetsp:Transcript_6982/g.6163  ORF Transcript_6982/g.6163 Transcript_6982/m.6163 type:complete len:160 (+) Transcript_6982:1276-1755(+)
MSSEQYLRLLVNSMQEAASLRSLKTCTETFTTYISETKPDIEKFNEVKELIPLLESLFKKSINFREILAVIIMTLQETYELHGESSKTYESLLSPKLMEYLSTLTQGKLNRFEIAKCSMIKRGKMILYSIQEEHEENDLHLCEEGYESLDQLSEETSSQ